MTIKRYAVASFLKNHKRLISENNFHLVARPKNLQGLATLGLTIKQCPGVINSLTIQNYSSGPLPNEDYPGWVMVFGKEIGQQDIYLKLSNTDKSGIKSQAVCISIHKAEHPLNFPFR